MKKLISAATSLAMAATMLGTAVPFATGAADTTKGLELRAFNGAATTYGADYVTNGVTTKAITVPVGVYLTEATNDTEGIAAQFSVKSADGDATNKYVSFISTASGDPYFDSAQTFQTPTGSVDTKYLVGWAGSFETNRRTGETTYSATGSLSAFHDTKQDSANLPNNAYAAVTWATPGDKSGYTWTGSKSDDFPLIVTDVTFAAGTPAGTYEIYFLEYAPDPSHPANQACMVENSTGKITKTAGGLSLKNLTITIGDSSTPVVTTTAAQTPVITTTTKANDTTVDPPVQPGEVDDYTITVNPITVKPGSTDGELEIYADPGKHGTATIVLEIGDLPQGIEWELDNLAYGTPKSTKWTKQGDTFYCDCIDNGDPVKINPDEPIAVLYLTVPEGATPGEYNWAPARVHIVENGHDKIEFDPTVVSGVITIEGDAPAVTTTKAAATTTKADVPVVTTTAAPVGTPNWGDTNVDGNVNIADVVVLNKFLNDAKSITVTDQGKLNADCCDPKDGAGLDANDSDAIIKSIVHLVELPTTAAKLK